MNASKRLAWNAADVSRPGWWAFGLRTAVVLYVRFRLSAIQDWVRMGGSVKQHPHHDLNWGVIGGGLAVIGTGLVFATDSILWLILGAIFLFFFAWIVASVFLPLRLLPLRDVEIVKARRIEANRLLDARIKELNDALQEHLRLNEEAKKLTPP